ncbi:MAG: TonB-dependent receptor, partial [Polyangiaceae bacterium]
MTGTRRSTRTVFDSNVPVDVVSRADLQAVPSGDLNDKLAMTVPSFNVQRLPLFDGAIFNRPATLRGLSPDQTLVLINGKRRHRSAYIDVTAEGAQAVDLSEIPQSAIERIEVLRDGASAQYGSDAIAGVINIILRDKPGYSGYLQGSRYYEGDGSNLLAGVNAGWALGAKGSLNLSLEGNLGAATSRSNQRPDAAALIDAGNPYIRKPAVQRFGQPSTRGFTAFLNGKYQLSDSVELYAFGSLGLRRGESDFNYRNPSQGTVFISTQPAAAFQQNFATLPQEYQDWYNNDPASASGYPGGFTPRFSATSLDRSAVVGIRGELTPDLSWDLSGRYGANHIAYRIGNTLNASQGPYSKKEFDPGSKQQTELGSNLDFNYSLGVGLPTPLNIAFGGEVRRESYTASAGEPDSYAIGPLSAIGLAGGANGFFGTAPEQAGTWGRNSVAGYADVDADLTRRLNVDVAGRAENYSDAGSTLNGKLSSRIAITDYLNLRGALSTGFRAPTPGQQNLINTAQYPSQDGTAILTIGSIPPTNPIAALKGGSALKPERSVNISLGFAIQPLKKLTASLDLYRIDVRDRIGLSQRYVLSDDERAALVASGVAAAQGLSVFNFFVNGYKTRTQGLDLVFAYGIDLARESQLNLSAALNLNHTEVLSFRDGVIDARQRQFIEDRLPKRVTTLGAEYVLGKASIVARAREYGSWTEPLDSQT